MSDDLSFGEIKNLFEKEGVEFDGVVLRRSHLKEIEEKEQEYLAKIKDLESKLKSVRIRSERSLKYCLLDVTQHYENHIAKLEDLLYDSEGDPQTLLDSLEKANAKCKDLEFQVAMLNKVKLTNISSELAALYMYACETAKESYSKEISSKDNRIKKLRTALAEATLWNWKDGRNEIPKKTVESILDLIYKKDEAKTLKPIGTDIQVPEEKDTT